MASRIKHRVEPAVGWLFVIVAIAALAGAIYVATQPMVDVNGPYDIRLAR